MVDVTRQGDSVVFTVRGVHRLLALKGRVVVPRAAIRAARRADPDATHGLWHGLRMPGTHVPGVIVAGTFYRKGKRTFWDVRKAARAIVVELEGHRYDQLVVEVADPAATLALLDGARTA